MVIITNAPAINFSDSTFVRIIKWWKITRFKDKEFKSFFKTIRRPTVNYEKNGVKLNKFILKNLVETHHPGILLNLIFTINNFKH